MEPGLLFRGPGSLLYEARLYLFTLRAERENGVAVVGFSRTEDH